MLEESMKSFITDSPFSFRNPIFFSVPRDSSSYAKTVNPITSKRKLFSDEISEDQQKTNSLHREVSFQTIKTAETLNAFFEDSKFNIQHEPS